MALQIAQFDNEDDARKHDSYLDYQYSLLSSEDKYHYFMEFLLMDYRDEYGNIIPGVLENKKKIIEWNGK